MHSVFTLPELLTQRQLLYALPLQRRHPPPLPGRSVQERHKLKAWAGTSLNKVPLKKQKLPAAVITSE